VSPIIAKEPENTYVPAPTGMHQAVCCDVVDLGMVKTVYNGQEKIQHKIQIRWFINEEMPADKVGPDGIPFFMVTSRYTNSLYETAVLRKHLTSWRGKSFTKAELAGFDVENVIGANCQLNIVHNESGGNTYANVEAVTPLAKGMQKMEIPEGYVRAKDREGYTPPVTQPEPGPDWPESDHDDLDDLPF
jgi:hypothetical protein